MRLLIKPGAQFPVDGEIAKGSTATDESNLTGEATPVKKTVGDTALAGTINLWGAVELVVARPAAESALQKIIKLIKEAQQQESPRAAIHRQIQHDLHLLRHRPFVRDVFRLVARFPSGAVQRPAWKSTARFTAP